MDRATGRAVVLGLTGAVFVVVAVMTLLDPDQTAAGLGQALHGADGHSEFHAVYVGLWLAQAALCAWAVWRRREPLLGDVVMLLVAGQVVGRVVATFRSGWPDQLIVPFVLEGIGLVLLAVLRPSRPARGALR